MATVAIVSEYNPFHYGHEHQINEIRRELGEQTEIIAIMSGNYVQRGDVSVTDKITRASAAVACGVNLVLELPFPYSVSSAEFFARAAISIASSIGVVDYISFGSECGDIKLLCKIADNMSSELYKEELSILDKSDELEACGYAQLCEKAYRRAFGEDAPNDIFKPNNILAIEYLKAIKKLGSNIKPHTVKRIGADYSDGEITETKYQSATAIRNAIAKGDFCALDHLPATAKDIYERALYSGLFPCDSEKLAPAIISSFLLNTPNGNASIHDAKGGLYNRLRNNCYRATSISELVRLTETKKYTNSRIRRAIFYSFFGVTSSEVKELPAYSQVLALDSVGRKILKRIKLESDFPIITKPSSVEGLSMAASSQRMRANTADALFAITFPKSKSCDHAIKSSPYVKK